MGKPSFSTKQQARRRKNWLMNKFAQAKQSYYDNINKRQKKEHSNDF